MSQATQEHEVLASAETVDELADKMHELITKYRLYSRDPDSLVGIYDTEEEARDMMDSISYDMVQAQHFYIMRGDDVIFGEQKTMWA